MKLLSLENLGDVKIEEVAVEDGLDAAGDDSDDVIEALEVVAVDPVEDVEATVGAEGEQVVAGDRLGLPGLGDHEQLGQDGDALQVDGEGPQDLHHAELVVDDKTEEDAGAKEELNPECVVVAVIGRLSLIGKKLRMDRNLETCLKFLVNEIDSSGSAGDEEQLHDGVIEADEADEEVQVAADEHDQEEDLGLARDAGTAPGLPDLHQEKDNRQQVRQVSEQTENIHLVWKIVNKFCLRHFRNIL